MEVTAVYMLIVYVDKILAKYYIWLYSF